MALEKRTIGRLPVSRGNWNAAATFYKYNIVTNNGSTFMSIWDGDPFSGQTYEPSVEYVAGQYIIKINGVAQTASTTYWQLMSYGGDAAQIAEDIQNKADGTYDEGLGYVVATRAAEANDLVGESSDRVTDMARYIVRTTAGDLSIKTDNNSGRLKSVKGMLDANYQPFTGKIFRWNPFNLIHSDQFVQGAVSGGAIVAGSTNMYWFNVPKLECTGNNLNNASENNGCLFTVLQGTAKRDATTSDITVYYSATKPVVGTAVTALSPVAKSDGFRHFTCEEGYLLVIVSNNLNINQICAHIAWSGAWNLDWEDGMTQAQMVAGNPKRVIDFTTPANAIHAWGMAGIYDAQTGAGAYDEIVFDDDNTANRKTYRRIDRATIIGWVIDPDETSGEGGSEIVTHVAHIDFANMKSGGLHASKLFDDIQSIFPTETASLAMDDDKRMILKYTGTAKTSEELGALTSDYYLYFELATLVTGTHSVVAYGTPNDLSTEEFVETNSFTIVGSAITETSYIQGLRDYIRLLPTLIDNISRVTAEHLVSLKEDINALNRRFGEDLGDIRVQKINQNAYPTYMGYDMFKFSTDVPAAAPDFTGQLWIDTTNKIAYLATGISAASDWKRITNA